MPDEALTNAAVEWVRRMHDFVNALDEPLTERSLRVTDDFDYEDRRSGGTNFGHIDASGALPYMASIWAVSSGRPQMSMPEVIAVRGDRLAAVVEVIDYGDGNHIEGIVCYRLDPGLERLQRAVVQDLGEAEAAIRELDRMHAELDD